MKRLLSALLCFALGIVAFAASNPASEAKEVRAIIAKVNNYWQKNNKPEAWAFWDYAAYHTGNMEAYRLTQNADYLKYSTDWAEHNQWKGAKSTDRSKWEYHYGETDNHVLFGDWQICFQTYIDLYNILPVDNRIKRAKEVMDYEISTSRNDYWWWADGLYMVMPVMTKLYKLTGDQKYLDKLYEYLKYSDSIMLDEETGLYFRDAKYVYPKHQTPGGKKDFWARGDGWVLAGLAKVLQDMPSTYKHHDFFVKKFQKMAATVASIQQPEGYWTRSLLEPSFAPGPETSGTAFFTYGMLWGVNNGYLDEATYLPTIQKAWGYLKNTAMQKNGKIGYVQPIGEKAIPGQVVNANSETPFGTGAFLLAACEYTRYLEAQASSTSKGDRAYWVSLLTQMAEPVLSNMAEGNLQKNMHLEVSPNWDGRDKRPTWSASVASWQVWLPGSTFPTTTPPKVRSASRFANGRSRATRMPLTPQVPIISFGVATVRHLLTPPTLPRVSFVLTMCSGSRSTKPPRNATSKSSRSFVALTLLIPTGSFSLPPSRASL